MLKGEREKWLITRWICMEVHCENSVRCLRGQKTVVVTGHAGRQGIPHSRRWLGNLEDMVVR